MKATVQGFALRDELAKDFEGTVKSMVDGGFKGYEMGVYFGGQRPEVKRQVEGIVKALGGMIGCMWTPDEAENKMPYIRQQGLMVESCHLFFANAYESLMLDFVEEMVVFAKKNDIKQYVVSLMLSSWEDALPYLPVLKSVSERLESEGIHLAYHNHDKEMVMTEEGITVLEKLLDKIPTLSLQPDIGWMEAGDGPVKSILEKYSDRIYTLHFKDLILDEWKKGTMVCTPIGYGDVDSLIVKDLLSEIPLLETGFVIDQDNARGEMMAELIQGKEYIIERLSL